MRPLTARQQRFVSAYVAGASAAEAARQAGYGPGYAAKAAKYLLQHPSIAATIEEMRMDLQKKTLFDVERAVEECNTMIDFAQSKNNAMAAAKLLELKCKLHGLLIERVEVKPSVDIRDALAAARSRVAAHGLAVRVLPDSAGDPFAD